MIPVMETPRKAKDLGAVFKDAGHSLYMVGGAVRDFLLGKPSDDVDFTTDATPEEVMALFPGKVIPTGIKHGTVTVRYRKESFEVTTFRSEGAYSDSRHPDSVTFVRDLAGDLMRRDFTINAFAADAITGEITDLHGGMADLEAKVIRAIGNPGERFSEDALRMLRACRFAAKLGFSVEEGTLEAIRKLSKNIRAVSAERIREELFKTLASPNPVIGIRLMKETGLLREVLPEVDALSGVSQGGFHTLDVFEHTMAALDEAAKRNSELVVRVAVLLHDIGKPSCMRTDGNRPTFHGHDKAGARMADSVMKRLKCSNDERGMVTLLVGEHMFHYTRDWSDGAVRRFMARVGDEAMPLLLELRRCDEAAIPLLPASERLTDELEERILREREKGSALSLKDLAVTGKDLMELGIPGGPGLGKCLNHLLSKVVEEGKGNTREELLAEARLWMKG